MKVLPKFKIRGNERIKRRHSLWMNVWGVYGSEGQVNKGRSFRLAGLGV